MSLDAALPTRSPLGSTPSTTVPYARTLILPSTIAGTVWGDMQDGAATIVSMQKGFKTVAGSIIGAGQGGERC